MHRRFFPSPNLYMIPQLLVDSQSIADLILSLGSCCSYVNLYTACDFTDISK